jgi:hypothetical protein
MNLMLTVIFICIALGLVFPKPGRWQNLAIVVSAITMTGLYYFLRRFM